MAMRIVPGMVSATFRDKPADEIIRLCTQNGLRAVEWSENAHVMPDDPAQAADLLSRTKAAGLAVAAYGSYYRLGEQVDAEAVFRRSLVSAVALDAPLIRVWAGTKPSVEADDAYRVAIAAEAAVIAGMAAAEGIRVAFEWHKNTLTDENETAIALLAQANHPNLCCLWQPTVALSEGQRIEGIRMLGKRLANFHVYYWPDGKRAPLASGEAQWLAYFGAAELEGVRYALLEFVKDNAEEQLAADAAALLGFLKTGGYNG